MTVIALPLAAAIVGSLLYLIPSMPSKMQELGRIVFACAFFVLMLYAAGSTLRIGVSP